MTLNSSAHYRLSLVLSDGDEYTTIITYYDGGAEPPYGGVSAPELTEDVDFTFEQASFLAKSVDTWIDEVVHIMRSTIEITRYAVPDLDMETRMWMDAGGLKLKITSETLDAEFTYDPADANGLIIMKARGAFDLSWRGFLYYHKTFQQYLAKIEEL